MSERNKALDDDDDGTDFSRRSFQEARSRAFTDLREWGVLE